EFFVGGAGKFAGAALDGAFDVVGGHVLRFGIIDGFAQARVLVGVAARLGPMLISRIRRVNILPRLASRAPFLCLIVAHFEWPDMMNLVSMNAQGSPVGSATGASKRCRRTQIIAW